MNRSSSEFDTVLDLCEDKHRRFVLTVLAEQQRSLTMDDLTKMAVKRNRHTRPTAVSGEIVTRVKTGLHHVHIPKLEEAGLIEYDSERQLVEPTAEFDRMEPYLSAILGADPELATSPWKEHSTCVTGSNEEGEWTY